MNQGAHENTPQSRSVMCSKFANLPNSQWMNKYFHACDWTHHVRDEGHNHGHSRIPVCFLLVLLMNQFVEQLTKDYLDR